MKKKEVIQLINDYWKFDNDQDNLSTWHDKKNLIREIEKLTLTDVGNCQFEAYATFCIECDRKGMKPLKYKDYLKIG